MSADHDDLLAKGPLQVPEPETAEERSARLGKRGLAGGALAGGAAVLKFGGAAKLFLWLVAWNGALDLWRLGGWIAILILAAGVTLALVVRSRREG